MKKQMKKYKELLVAILIIGVAIFLLIALYAYGNKEPEPITEFSTDNWLDVERNQRYHMLEDLYTEVELIGMSAEEVEELLGPWGQKCKDYWYKGEWCDYGWVYYVRTDWFNGDEGLMIDFRDDVVISYELVYGWEL